MSFASHGSATAIVEEFTSSSSQSAPLSVREFFKNKVILCTGCTGFVGKVLLEKILRCLPEVKKVYIMVRAKKGITPFDRLKKEIMDSPIFSRVKKEIGLERFEKITKEKFYPAVGDVSFESPFTMEKEEFEKMRNEVNIVLHSAATIDFYEKLNLAIGLNTYGGLRMLQFAQSCPNIEVFTHVSTAYTNSNQPNGSSVDERQYNLQFPNNESIENFCERVIKMKPEEVTKVSDKILAHFKYPNTYTFTKCMAEHLIAKYRGNLPVAIVRPTIVGCSWREPVPGWIDAVSAAASTYFFLGLGVLNYLEGDEKAISDQIPVDFVVNAMLACTASVVHESKRSGRSIMKTFHSGSSDKNPVSWKLAFDTVHRYWATHRSIKAIGDPQFRLIKDPLNYKTAVFSKFQPFIQLFNALGVVLRNRKYSTLAMQLQKVESRNIQLTTNFRHFTLNEWIFSNSNIQEVIRSMVPEERDIFFLDVKAIDWPLYFTYFSYGIHKFVLKENPVEPTKVDLTRSTKMFWFGDLAFAYYTGSDFKMLRSTDELKKSILASKTVQYEIQQEAVRCSSTWNEIEDKAKSILNFMCAEPKMSYVRVIAYMFTKIYKKMYQSVIVDDEDIDKLRSLYRSQDTGGPLVIIPTQRSYIDTFILAYIMTAYELPLPLLATGEEFSQMAIFGKLFKYLGSFFIKRPIGDNPLYRAIYNEYISQLLVDHVPLQHFIEGSRSRGGKVLQPKFDFLNVVVDTFLNHRVSNVTIVPVHIGYEKLLEAESFSKELLGESKNPETLRNLIAARNIVKKRYGDIDVKFGSPIPLNSFIKDVLATQKSLDPYASDQDKAVVSRKLGFRIIYELNRAATIMPTSLVATVVLAYRNGQSMEELTTRVLWLKEQVKLRGATVSWGDKSNAIATSAVIDKAIKLLSNLVSIQRHMIEPNVKSASDFRNIIQLSLYRNQLIHLFADEGIVCCALESFGQTKAFEQGVDRDALKEESAFLSRLLNIEFISRPNQDEEQDFNGIIDKLVERNVLEVNEQGSVIVSRKGYDSFYFILNLILPFIESYWATSISLCSLPGVEIQETAFIERTQWLVEKNVRDGKMKFYESCSLETIRNAVSAFVDVKVLLRRKKKLPTNPKKKVKEDESVEDIYLKLADSYANVDELLKFVKRIGRFHQNGVNTSSLIRGSLTDDMMPNIQVISKL